MAQSNNHLWQHHATRMAFLVAGLITAAWAPLVPYAKNRLMLDDGLLGVLLLCLGGGSLLAMPFAGVLVARYGCRLTVSIATLILCLVLPWLALAGSFAGMVVGLLIFGAGIGIVDVAINIQALAMEKQSRRAMMSGFHGLFSLGGILGASGVTFALSSGFSPFAAAAAISALVALLFTALGRHLMPQAVDQRSPFFVMPHGTIILIGVLCFICYLAEGAMLDWSAVFLTTERNLDPAHAGLGYAAFSITMTAGRFAGDRIVRLLGGPVVMTVGGFCATAGLVIAVAFHQPMAAFIGFALVGLGASNIVPVLYSAAGRQKIMPPHLAIAAVSVLGYSGILAGPAAIGFTAHIFGLPAALLGIAVLLAGLALSAHRIIK